MTRRLKICLWKGCLISERTIVPAASVLIRPMGISEDIRNEIIIKLAEKGISSNVHYKPLPMLTAYKNLGFNIQDYPHSYNYYKNEITLPLYSKLTDEQVKYVINGVKDIMRVFK